MLWLHTCELIELVYLSVHSKRPPAEIPLGTLERGKGMGITDRALIKREITFCVCLVPLPDSMSFTKNTAEEYIDPISTAQDSKADHLPMDVKTDYTPMDGQVDYTPMDGMVDYTPMDGQADYTPIDGTQRAVPEEQYAEIPANRSRRLQVSEPALV